MKVSDYIADRLATLGVRHVFMVTGGGAMHLNDSIGRHPDLKYICTHHEQAAAMAAEGYARLSGGLAVVCVTSGPGGTNCLTGVLGQWTDSVPVLYLSGNVKRETSIQFCREPGLRQLGDQEADIINIVQPVAKYAYYCHDKDDVPKVLDMAIHYALSGRPGPVWLDIPLDVQAAEIDCFIYRRQTEKIWNIDLATPARLLMEASSRPVIIAGHGIRISKAKHLLHQVAEKHNIPVVTTFNGMDLMPDDHPLFAGRIGTIGTSPGNATVERADLLICIGTRNNIRQVSYDWGNFGAQAMKIVVDIDEAELRKKTIRKEVSADMHIHCDAGHFLDWMNSLDPLDKGWKHPSGTARVPMLTMTGMDPYQYVRARTALLPDDAIIVSGNGTASVALFQYGVVKKDTRVIMNSGTASMGYDLPAAIGACLASGGKEVVCLTGDGSIMMNIQELATIAAHGLPVRIIVLDNGGYQSIRLTQDEYFNWRRVGADYYSGVRIPDLKLVAEAFGVDIEVVKLGQDYKFHKHSWPVPERAHA